MSKSIKFKNNTYLDSCGVVFERKPLNKILTFSTEEQIIGKWFEKNLYRKVLEVDNINGTNIKTISLPTNIDILLPYEGMLFDSDGNEYFLNYNNIWNSNQDIGSFYYKGKGIQIKCYADFGITNGFIIIKYTKTID